MKIGEYLKCENCGASIPVEAPPNDGRVYEDDIETDCPRCGVEVCFIIEWPEQSDDQFAAERDWLGT